ncbi:ectoine hydroxylase-related dioxygenase (phytanoyl-CoA dioxygenase family) [Kribbella amoyensis]|uniref:Ectoine hydroxylase-related dioxygenase (Phytanoyl-CoA dioxygenase family) n=1 Tax=Kribbella amoyensis TaxID=996641 RepID=A0A561BUV0_9ACTN|nr:phytanoyl-CoA dioxygenase family protein [Kribbella amoyensis]TWD82573.1 ectoine hydroxylase-related dioxygenase (phytanoyl-CoA dioxygenase family) [Kribbella amoyensis]
MATPTELDDYLFDLRGYLVLEQALEPDLVDDLNTALDALPRLQPQAWFGNVQRVDNNPGDAGLELQNIVEGGSAFERLIDHPSWLGHVRRYCGEQDSYVEGLFIDECFATIRQHGGFFPVHSGGYRGAVRGQYRYDNGLFRCGQVNILMALTDIGVGDGGTLVVPGSHKSNLQHPCFEDYATWRTPMDTMPGVVEVHLRKGDALLFCDGLSHGASTRTNPGERRAVIYRYGPSWATTRYGYTYSEELLTRVTPQRKAILRPIPPRQPPTA